MNSDSDSDRQRLQENEASLSWMANNTKMCPGCQVRIEKSDGCNHMTCNNGGCRQQFCWVCLLVYVNGGRQCTCG